MSDRALAYVVEFPGTNGDSEVWKSTLWTPYWESIGSAFLRLGFAYNVRRIESITMRDAKRIMNECDNLYRIGGSIMPSSALKNPTRHQHWDVQEGEAQEIAPRLKNIAARALVFVSSGKDDDQRTKARFDTLRQASELIDMLLDSKQEDRWKALVEALTPDVPLSPNRLIDAGMFAQAIQGIVESKDFARAADIAEAARFSKTNTSSQPNRWKKSG